MANNTILRTVQVGLNSNGDFKVDVDTYDVKAREGEIVATLNAHLPEPDGQAIVDTYQKFKVDTPGGSPFNVVSNGPTIFLYVVDTSTMENWRFDNDRGLMARKPNAPQSQEVFDRNFPLAFPVFTDDKGVIMFATCDVCVDHSPSMGADPDSVFSFDIFMQIIENSSSSAGRVTKITIDPDTDNTDSNTRNPIGG